MTLTPNSSLIGTKAVTTSVTVIYGTNGGSIVTPSVTPPSVSVNNNVLQPGLSYNIGGTSATLAISIPSGGCTYSYSVNGGTSYTLTNGQVNSVILDNIGLQTKTLVISAYSNGSVVGTWTYSITFGVL